MSIVNVSNNKCRYSMHGTHAMHASRLNHLVIHQLWGAGIHQASPSPEYLLFLQILTIHSLFCFIGIAIGIAIAIEKE